MFHCSRYEVRDRNHVLLWEWIGDLTFKIKCDYCDASEKNPTANKAHVKIIREEIRNIGTDIQRVLHVFSLIGCRVNSEFGSVPLRVLFRKLKIANDEASKICHHGYALFKRYLGKPTSWGVLNLQSIRRQLVSECILHGFRERTRPVVLLACCSKRHIFRMAALASSKMWI